MDYDIPQYFKNLIHEIPSFSIAEAEFRRNMEYDEQLRNAYKKWCEDEGYELRTGFMDFCQEYADERNDMWNTLTDYDE